MVTDTHIPFFLKVLLFFSQVPPTTSKSASKKASPVARSLSVELAATASGSPKPKPKSRAQAVSIQALPEFGPPTASRETSRREKIQERRRLGVLTLPVEVIEKPSPDCEAYVREVTSHDFFFLLKFA